MGVSDIEIQKTPLWKWSFLTLLIGVVLVGCSPAPSSEELFQSALNADSPAERETSAIELSHQGEQSVEYMRQLYTKSDVPQVRAAVARGLGHAKDIDSLPALIDGLESESSLVRFQSNRAIISILNMDLHFAADGSVEERQKVIAAYRDFWNTRLAPGASDSKEIRRRLNSARVKRSTSAT